MASRASTPLWRDVRFWRVASQVLFLAVLAAAANYFLRNMQQNLVKQGLKLGFGFLKDPASFAIAETAIDYSPADSYGRAILVGVVNTLQVAVVGIALATPLGMAIGILRLSGNWLVNRLAAVYVEAVRNTPLLVQMAIWYFAVFLNLPPVEQQVVLPGPIYLNNRGAAVPWFDRSPTFWPWLLVVAAAATAAIAVWRWRTRRLVETGQAGQPALLALGLFLGAAAAAWLLLPQAPLSFKRPQVQGNSVHGGAQLSPEFAALVTSLVVYTAAFIAEIVRAGIQAVPKGQWEAARALGLKPFQVMRLVVLPQALRVIIPPLTSQYLNLTKNSSLAMYIGYADVFYVTGTVISQTGRAVESFLILMLVYASFSLVTSLLMNLYNRSVRLVER